MNKVSFFCGMILMVIVAHLLGALSPDVSSRQVIKLDHKFGAVLNSPLAQFKPVIRLTKGSTPHCSAFVIDGAYAITAAHCLVDDKQKLLKTKFQVFDESGLDTKTTAIPAGVALRSDLGLITGDFRNFMPIKTDLNHFGFYSKSPYFLACGYPYGQKQLICNFYVPNGQGYSFAILGQSYFVPGMSGGPVIDPVTGEAIALISYGSDGSGYGVYPLQGFLGAFGLD